MGYRPEWETMPIRNLPADTVKFWRRIRKDARMVVYVRTEKAVRRYSVGPAGGVFTGATALELVDVLGANVRQRNPALDASAAAE